jgi:hypothetical protein
MTTTLRLLPRFLACGFAAALSLGALQADATKPGLTVRDGKFLLEGRPYRGVGVNYYDLFKRVVGSSGDESSLLGLAALGRSGVPFVRFNAGGWHEREWRRYLDNPEAHWAAMDRVVRAAEEAGVGLIPSLFWTHRLAFAFDERMSDWGRADSRTIAEMRRYTAAMVMRYRSSPAIWAWEFGNEWNLNADLPNAADFRPKGGDERDDLTNTALSFALAEFAAVVRAHDATRPLMTGHSHPRFAAWHNTHKRSWGADSFEQWREILHRDNPPPYDTVGIHIYADTEATEVCARWTTGWGDYVGKLRAFATETRRPLFIGEFGLAEGDKFSPEQVKARYRDILAAMEAADVDLAALWVFDLPSQAKDWSVTFDNARAYMLHDVIEAHRRWRASAPTTPPEKAMPRKQ